MISENIDVMERIPVIEWLIIRRSILVKPGEFIKIAPEDLLDLGFKFILRHKTSRTRLGLVLLDVTGADLPSGLVSGGRDYN